MSLSNAVKRKIYVGISVLAVMLPSSTVFAMQNSGSESPGTMRPGSSSSSESESESHSNNLGKSNNPNNPSNNVGSKSDESNKELNKDQEHQHLSSIHSRGGQEISRRLSYLNNLLTQINNATHLTASDKTALTSEINNEIASLTALQSTLASQTSLSSAKTNVQSMITEYRVFSLVIPKVRMIIYADNQQNNEAKLSTLSGKLETRIAAAKTAGTDVTSLQTKLDDMKSKISAAQALSSSVETGLLGITPDQYNANKSILAPYHADLGTAHADNQVAYNDAKSIIEGLGSNSNSTTTPTTKPMN